MSKYKFRYIFAAVFLAISLIFIYIVAGRFTMAYAATSSVQAQYEKRNIIKDLEKSQINGEPFDFSEWNFDETKDTQVLSFIEFCYSFQASKRGDFGLYVYVYNPKGLAYDYGSTLNSLLMAYAPAFDDETVEYLPYRLEFLNMSTTAKYEGLFLKYKVTLSADDKEKIFSVMNSTERVYKVAEIQLLGKGDMNPTAYAVGNTYTYSGYSEGYGSAAATEDSLTCSVLGLTSISPRVHQTFFRPDGSNGNNSYTQDTLYSVYFSVPNKLLEEYGELVEIRATWLKTMLQWAFVTGDQEFYDFAYNLRGYDMAHLIETASMGSKNGYPNSSSGSYSAWEKSNLKNGNLGNVSSKRIYGYSYEGRGVFDYGRQFMDAGNCGWFSGIYWAGSGLDSADKYIVPSEDILQTMKNYHDYYDGRDVYEYVKHTKAGEYYFTNTFWTYTPYNGEYLEVDGITYPYSKALFESWDKKATFADVSASKEYKLTSQKIDKGFWEKLFGGSHVVSSTTFDGIKAIQKVEASDIKPTAKETSTNLYINVNDVADFKEFYNSATAANEAVYLFRFDMGEYVALEAALGTSNNSTLVTPNIDIKNTNGRVFKQNAYLGFELIHLKFEGDKGITIIPVVMSPMTIVADGDPALHTHSDFNWWKIILAVLLLIILLVILMPVLPHIISGIVWLVTAPFKATDKFLTRRKEKRREKQAKRVQSEPKVKQPKPPNLSGSVDPKEVDAYLDSIDWSSVNWTKLDGKGG